MKKITLLIAFFLSVLYGQNALPGYYIFDSRSIESGLPQNSVADILQAKDGYIWLTTYAGLVRFDGVKFTVFSTFTSPGIESDRMAQIEEDSNNQLWILSDKGIIKYNRNEPDKAKAFRTFSSKDGLPDRGVFSICKDSSGTVFLMTGTNVIFRFTGGSFVPETVSTDEQLRRRALNGEGEFLSFSGTQIIKLIDNKPVLYLNTIKYSPYQIWQIKQGPDGLLYVATNGDGILVFNPAEISKYEKITQANGLSSNIIREIFFDKAGVLWATGRNGINKITVSGNKPVYNVEKMVFPDKYVYCGMQDNEGNFWFGTETEGLLAIKSAVLKTYGAEQGLKMENLLSLCSGPRGVLYIATNCGGIYELNNGKIIFSPLNKILVNSCIWSIFKDSRERIWISSGELIRVDNGKVTYFNKDKNFFGGLISVLYEDDEQNIWVGCDEGLFKFTDDKFVKYTVANGLTNNRVCSLLKDKQGNLWIGTIDGLNIMREGKISRYPLIPTIRSNYIRSLYEDSEGVLWIGTYGSGLIRIKNGKQFLFNTQNGLYDNVVSQIVEDKYGHFWCGSNRGITRMNRHELNQFAEGKTASFTSITYGKMDGMLSAETNGGFQPNAILHTNGRIYFPTIRGLVEIDPSKLRRTAHTPMVHIENIIIEGRNVPEVIARDNGIQQQYEQVFPYDSSNIEIDFTALSFSDPQGISFKYKLIGLEENWIDAGNKRSVHFLRLQPGRYTFKVIAGSKEGVWNYNGATVSFVIAPPFWDTWWFRGFLILFFVVAGPIIYLIRVSGLKKERLRQQEFSGKLIESQEAERKRIAGELHDGLGQNLLVIKSRLNSALTIESADEVKNRISETESFVTNSIREVRAISRDLSPYLIDQLGLTAAIENMVSTVSDSTGIKIEAHFDNIDGLFNERPETGIYRIVQEALNNIIKHSGASEAGIKIVKESNRVVLSIKDNGRGFYPEDEQVQRGFGIAGIKERTRILNGELTINSEVHSGTELIIRIPIP